MPNSALEFDAVYDDSLIDSAAKAFVHRLFKKYLWVLVAACLLNIVGFIFVLIFPGSGTLMTAAIGILAALGPLYFPWAYFRFPGKFAAPMKRVLKPAARVSVSSSGFSLSAHGRSFTREWTKLKEILEFPEYFLLVIAPMAFTFIPKKDVPLEAQQLIRDASRSLVQPNPLMQPTGQERPAAD